MVTVPPTKPTPNVLSKVKLTVMVESGVGRADILVSGMPVESIFNTNTLPVCAATEVTVASSASETIQHIRTY